MRGADKGSVQILQAVVHSQPRPKENNGPGSSAQCGVLSGGDWVLLLWMSGAPCSRYHDEQVAVFLRLLCNQEPVKGVIICKMIT
ncbi:hypothetical protein FOVSG1_007786 [Fusarium oxysporum f. sp. vasinfectum]